MADVTISQVEQSPSFVEHSIDIGLTGDHGDAHDIGKNLVDIILTSNGYGSSISLSLFFDVFGPTVGLT